jgi:hypothetical protein
MNETDILEACRPFWAAGILETKIELTIFFGSKISYP